MSYPKDVSGRLVLVGDVVEYPANSSQLRTVQEIRGVSGCVIRLDIEGYPWVGPQRMRIVTGADKPVERLPCPPTVEFMFPAPEPLVDYDAAIRRARQALRRGSSA